MEALRTRIATSKCIRFASRAVVAGAGARAIARVRCCSSSSLSPAPEASVGSTAADVNQVSDRRQRSLSSTSDKESIRAIRVKKVEGLRSIDYEPYSYNWDISHEARQLQDIYSYLGNGEECKEASVSVAGRVIACRNFGKLTFCTLRDDSGTVQLYFEKEHLPEDQFELLKTFVDIGDLLGARGSIKKTNKGEISVFVKFFGILTKCLLPLPDKYHGLADVDKRYHQRYVDMIANPEVADIMDIRAVITTEIRNTVESWGFIEVGTPTLLGAAGGAEAKPFVTYHNSLGKKLHLRIATELHLKKILVGGRSKVYEIGRIFRNEGISARHNPEFTTIEMYEAYTDYFSMMDKAEEIITRCVLKVHGKLKIDYLGTEICFERPWRRESMHDLVKEATGIDFGEFKDDLTAAKEAAIAILKSTTENYDALLHACPSVGHVLNEVFEIIVEPKLVQPTIVLDYPIEISPLARAHRRKPGLVERFELFIYGRELANACSELTDPIEQRARFVKQIEQHNKKRATLAEQKKENSDYSYDISIDEDFITALEYGMPPASGLGLGIDRLVMLLTNSASIKDVIAFPAVNVQQ